MTKPPDPQVNRLRGAKADLAAAWEQNAPLWVAWARKPGHDSYHRFHRDQFLELVPEARGRTLDLGCGEGRLARDLAGLGHDVVGVDVSTTMVEAARQAAPELEFHEADAAALPFPEERFDLVVAFMSLQDVDDLAHAVREAARVLVRGGRLCAALVHPIASAGTFAGGDADSPFVIDGSYLDPSGYVDEIARDGLEMRFVSVHRPLEAYTEALCAAGLLIERLREPPLPEHAVRTERGRRWQRVPGFLHLRALKPLSVADGLDLDEGARR